MFYIVLFLFAYILQKRVAFTVDKSKYITGYRTLNSFGEIIRIHKDPNDLLVKKPCSI